MTKNLPSGRGLEYDMHTSIEHRSRSGGGQMIKVNGKDYPWEEGLSIKQLLVNKGFTFPLLVVILNGKAIADNEYVGTVVNDGDEVKIIHLMSGG